MGRGAKGETSKEGASGLIKANWGQAHLPDCEYFILIMLAHLYLW